MTGKTFMTPQSVLSRVFPIFFSVSLENFTVPFSLNLILRIFPFRLSFMSLIQVISARVILYFCPRPKEIISSFARAEAEIIMLEMKNMNTLMLVLSELDFHRSPCLTTYLKETSPISKALQQKALLPS